MEAIDLIELLEQCPQKQMPHVTVYGLVRKQVKRPRDLGGYVDIGEGNIFVKLEVLAIDVGYRGRNELTSYGCTNEKTPNKYVVKGEMLALVNKEELKPRVGKWLELTGTVYRAVDYPEVMYLYNFKRSTQTEGKSEWKLTPSKIDLLEVTQFREGSLIRERLLKSRESNKNKLKDVEEIKELQGFTYEVPEGLVVEVLENKE